MGSKQPFVTFTLFAYILLCASTVFSAPFLAQQSCSAVCRISPESAKIKYEQDKSYVYNFETKVATKLVGTSDEESVINVKGQAILAAQSACDFILTVQQIVIEGPDGKRVGGKNELEGSSIRFGFQDGELEGICVESGESVWVTNFKRALVSMFQNRAVQAIGDATVMEVDVSGRCPTEYTLTGSTYTKKRDLNKCSYREGGKWILQGIPYTSFSGQNSNPIIDSDLTCVQELSANGIFNSMACSETNKLRALASGQAGALTVIDSKLTLLQTKNGIPALKTSVVFTPSQFLFDHLKIDSSAATRRATATNSLKLLRKLCTEISSGTVSSMVPGLFQELKKALQLAQGDDLLATYNKIKDGSACSSAVGQDKLHKLFIDASIATASTESIVLIAKLIEEGKLLRHTEELFVLYTSYANRPQEPALTAFRTLITNPDIHNSFLLAASGLAHQYCKTTNPDCGSNKEYILLVSKISQFAGDNCDTDLKNSIATKKAVSAFQALGNLDALSPEAVHVIATCLKSSTVSNEIKIRALDSFRSDSCQQELKREAFTIFKNKELSSEVRIQAYLSSVRCLEQDDVDSIQRALDNEESNQVGSFVSSHIANILSSSSPGKRGIKVPFKKIRMTKSFHRDPRVFSKNFEVSTFSSERNVGFSAEGNLIYSQDSYIPRTTTGNLTVDLFGRSYQLFEYGLYLENFEKLFEKFFGPAGLFSKNPGADVMKELRSGFSSLQSVVGLRFKRQTNTINFNEIDAIHNEVSGQIKTRYEESKGFGDFYVRAFGLSILSESFTEEEITQQTFSKTFLTILDKFLEGAKDHKVEVTEPINFLNEEIILPTISGFPLNFQLEGTTVLSLQLQGKLDILALMGYQATAGMEIKSKVLPSAATIVKGKMSVGAGPVESGLQLEGKIHSSSGMIVSILKQAGKFEFTFNIPEEKIQLVDINSELFWVDQTGGELLKKSPLKSNLEERSVLDNQCTEALSGITGLKFCTHVKIPTLSAEAAPLFPLTGNSVLALSMKKVDAAMEGFYMKIDSGNENSTENTISIVLDTPGSKANRKIAANFRFFNEQSPKVELDITSPWRTVRVDFQRWNEALLQGVEFTAKTDGAEVSGIAKLKHIPDGNIGVTYEPTISYSFPSASVKVLEGKITRVYGKTMDINLRADGQQRALKGKMSGLVQINRKDSRNADFALSSIQFVNDAIGKLFLDGSFGLKETGNTLNLKANYGADAEHDLSLSGEYIQPTPKSKIFEVKVSSTRREFLNFDIRYESARSPKGFENTMLVHRGSDVGTRLTFSQSSKYSWESSKLFDIENLIQITYPKRNVDFYLKADAKNGLSQSGSFELRSGSAVNAVVKYDSAVEDFSSYDFVGSVNYPGHHVKVSEIAKNVNGEQWNYKTSFLSERDGQDPIKIDVDTDLSLRFSKSDILSELSSKLTSTYFAEPILFNTKVNAQTEFYLANIKLRRPSGDIVDLATEYRAALGNKPATFTSKAFLVSYLDGKLAGTNDRGFSKLNLDVMWVPTNRKVTVISDLKKQGHRYNLNTDLRWDATRDQSKAANIRNSITFQPGKFGIETTNDFLIEGRSSQLILNGKLANDYFNGENILDIKFQDTINARYVLGVTNVNENRDKTKVIDLGIKLDLPNQSPFELKVNNRASNMDFVNYIFELSTDLQISYQENKHLNLQAEMNSVLKNKRTISGKVDIGGTAISQPLRFDHTIEFQSDRFKIKASGERGSKADLEFESSYDFWSPKRTLEYKYKINTPYSKYRNIELNSKYSYFFNGWTNFDISEAGSITMNHGNPSSWNNGVSFVGPEFQARYNITAEGNSVVAFNLVARALAKKISVKIENAVKGGDIKLAVDYEKFFPNFNLRLFTSSPYKNYENMDFRIKHKVDAQGPIYKTDIQIKQASQTFTVSNKLENSLKKKAIDFILSGDNFSSKKLYLSLNEAETNKYSVDAVLRWDDDGRSISSKGELVRSGDSIVGDLTLDSPVLNAQGWNIHVTKGSNGGRKNLAVTVKNAQEETGHLILDYSQTGDDSLTVYDGDISAKARTYNFEGKFTLDNKIYVQASDGEEGREIKTVLRFSTESYPIKLEFIGKRTNAEINALSSFCNEGDQDCKSLEVSLLTKPNEYTCSIISKSITFGSKPAADSFIMKTATSGNNYEHSAKLRSIGDTEQEVGYKIFRYPDSNQPKAGFDFWLPERKVSVLLAKRQSKYIFDVWMNKLRNPDDKFAIIFEETLIAQEQEAGWGKEMSLVFQHPNFGKDLKIKTRGTYGGAKTLIDISTEIDIFKKNQELIISLKADRELTPRLQGGQWRVYSIDLGMSSKAQGLSLDIHSDIKTIGMDFTTKSTFVYLNREKQQRNYEISLEYMRDRRALEIIGPTGRIMSYSSSYRFHLLPRKTAPEGYDVRREIFLPGMADTRIFQNSLTISFPPSAHIKMFTATSPPGQFYEAWMGFKNDQHFSSGVYGHEEKGQFVLADFNIALNNSRLLFIETDWDNENIKEFMTKTEIRLQDTVNRYKTLSSASVDYLTKELDYQTSALMKSLPNLIPLLESYKEQFKQIKDEITTTEIVQHTAGYVELILNILGTDYEEVFAQFDELSVLYAQMFGNFQEFLDRLPEMFIRTIEGIPAAWSTARQSFSFAFDTFVNSLSNIMGSISKTVDGLSKSNPVIADNISILSDTTQGVGKSLKDILAMAIESLTGFWANTKSTTQNFMESEYVRNFVTYLTTKYESLLGDAIDGYKKQADTLRESIIKVLPDKELRELMSAIMQYVEKKTKNIEVDDNNAQKEIYEKFVTAIEKAGSRIFTINLKDGLITAHIPLPVPVKSLMEIDQVFDISLPSKAPTSQSMCSLRDVWNTLMRVNSIRDLVPPFESYAYIVGSQYFRTFDGKFYHFEGNCQYLLAADFAEKNFTIVVDFKKDTGSEIQKSIIMTDNKNIVVIQPENKVLYNGKPIDTTEGISEGEFSFYQAGDWTSVQWADSYIVECSTVQDVCTVQLNGFNLGRTRGLLGTYNNEIYDDLMAPSGVIQDSFEKVVPLWKVGRQCRERPLPTHTSVNNMDAIEKCRRTFRVSSSLSPCFDIENPSDYETVCASLAEEKGYDTQRAVCTAAYSYSKSCQNSGVDIDGSKFCEK